MATTGKGGNDINPFEERSNVQRTPAMKRPSQIGKNTEKCGVCNASEVSAGGPTIDWVQCENCSLWFHCECLKIPLPSPSDQFLCEKCKGVPQQTSNDNDEKSTKKSLAPSRKDSRHNSISVMSKRSSVIRREMELELLNLEKSNEIIMKSLQMQLDAEKKARLEEDEARKLARENELNIIEKIQKQQLDTLTKKVDLIRQALHDQATSNASDSDSVSSKHSSLVSYKVDIPSWLKGSNRRQDALHQHVQSYPAWQNTNRPLPANNLQYSDAPRTDCIKGKAIAPVQPKKEDQQLQNKPLINERNTTNCFDQKNKTTAYVKTVPSGMPPVNPLNKNSIHHHQLPTLGGNLYGNPNHFECNQRFSTFDPNQNDVKCNQRFLTNDVNQNDVRCNRELTSNFDYDEPVLTQKHLLARKALNTDLPIFNGQPEHWTMFINAFESTNKSCGFSKLENIDRLRKCLKDKAYRAVEDLLTSPDNLPEIIEILRRHFGNPKSIITSLVKKARSFPSIKLEDYEQLIEFSFVVRNLYSKIISSGLNCHLADPCLIDDLVAKLDPITKVKWLEYKSGQREETLPLFREWICRYAENFIAQEPVHSNNNKYGARRPDLKSKNTVNVHHAPPPTPAVQKKVQEHQSNTTAVSKCAVCEGECKSLQDCLKFRNFTVKERMQTVMKAKVCRRCLTGNHWFMRCKKICGKNGCIMRHHELLHDDQWNSGSQNNATVSNVSNQPKTQTTPISTTNVGRTNTHLENSSIMYQIVPVKVYANDKSFSTFAFLDTGSSLTLIEDGFANEMGLVGDPKPLILTWSDDSRRNEKDSRLVSFEVSSSVKRSKRFPLENVHTVKQLILPQQTVNLEKLGEDFKYLRGIPLESYEVGRPRILIGIDNAHLLSTIKSVDGKPGQLSAALTRLGWTVFGKTSNQNSDSQQMVDLHTHLHIRSTDDLHQLVEKHFAIDSLGIQNDNVVLSAAEARANKIMESTTVRNGNRFEIGLLWKFESVEMPNSLPTAHRRFRQLENRMQKDPELKSKLQTIMKDYVTKNYARKLTPDELKQEHSNIWYLPVFPVSNKNKPGKIRLVWDAASAVNGVSLNSLLLSGPDQLASLISVLYRFRQRKIAINADIREMFHQIRVKASDQQAQRFLWKDEESSEIDVYVLEVMTFGSTCSPSCAQYIKNKNASEFAAEYPKAAECIIASHYVDDLLDSVNTEDEAIQLANEVKWIHSRAGFDIRNWKSNSAVVIQSLEETSSAPDQNLDFDQQDTVEKVLGMWWCTKSDTFRFKITSNPNNEEILLGYRIPTKRELLKIVMSVYDPLGLLSHYIVFAKIILQCVWRSKLDWDDTINTEQSKKWRSWLSLLPSINSIRIPRCYLSDLNFDKANHIQLHLFADASEEAYAAAAYFRVESSGKVEVVLISAKSRVAPIKQLSIPRLELEAALIATRLAKDIVNKHSIDIQDVVYWSDSKTVLCWIRSEHRKYRQFVAHRVSEILDNSKIESWRYVPSANNVADDGTKWSSNTQFTSNDRWFTGPPFLMKSKDEWPEDVTLQLVTTEEIRAHHQHAEITGNQNSCILNPSVFSTWEKMLRTMCFLLRFLCNTYVIKSERMSGFFKQDEYAFAEIVLFKQAQSEGYPEEVACFDVQRRNNHPKAIPKTSTIYRDVAYMDGDGLLRAQGRIDNAEGIPDEMKRPIILPVKSRITELLIMSYHRKYHHLNNEIVINELRQRFIIPKLRRALKSLVKDCNYCKIRTAKPNPPMMGDLPKARLTSYSRPFTAVGIDYFGPILVTVGRRTEKRWGMIVTCLTTRAIHIELANTLSADSCIMCLRNFIARRGTPREIITDNGTNFRGANVELAEAVKRIDKDRLVAEFTDSTVTWNFNPPSSPHMGGSWERMVRSIKTILHEILKTKTPNDELLRSALIEVEGIINSRPLTYVPLDSTNDESLTPNHFLLGSSSGMKPLLSVEDTNHATLRKNWMTSQKIANEFWKKWVREYLPELTRRSKWFQNVKPIQKGDIVIIVDENNPRSCWPKGRVIDTTIDKHGQTRKAWVQTSTGVYERPAVKLAVLDIGVGKSTEEEDVPGGSVANAADSQDANPVYSHHSQIIVQFDNTA